jgi:putative heme iron utilization protein
MDDPGLQARRLLRAAAGATLATSDAGWPFASLVTPACTSDGAVLLLLSGLSPHTRHLRNEPRCSLLAQGAATDANPQTAPRVTVQGRAVPDPDPALRRRWLDRHPYAAFYADPAAGLNDFVIWRLTPESGQLVAGFGRAHRLAGAQLVSDSSAIDQAAPGVLAHMNADHADALAAIAAARCWPGAAWRMVGLDPDGFDMACGDMVHHVPFPAPTDNAGAVRAALMALTREAQKRDESHHI